MVRELTIPPPITEQNNDEYLRELDNIKEANDWVKKHSKSSHIDQDVEIQHSRNLSNAVDVVSDKSVPLIPSSVSTSDRFFVLLILGFMFFLFVFVFFTSGSLSEDACMFLLYLLPILLTPLFSRKKKEEQNQTLVQQENLDSVVYRVEKQHGVITQQQADRITIQQQDNLSNRPLAKFGIGFSVPFFLWVFMFVSLGEPCSVFCSGKEAWDVYSVILGNLCCGGFLFFNAFFDRKFLTWSFLFGFLAGSFIGLNVGAGLTM